jgi:SAM-dependent methyltransferase
VGTSGIVFAQAGCDVTLADVADPLLAFARWRFERRGLPVATLDLKRQRPPRGVFEGIVCFDVLEHIPRPLPVVRRLRDALRPGGLLFLVAPFGADPLRPMHVVHDDRVLDWFRALGFRRRDDMEDWFPSYMWLAQPRVYERVAMPAWKRAGYFVHDILLPEDAAGALRSVWARMAQRRA